MQPLPRLLPAGEDDGVLAAARVGSSGMRTPFGITSQVARHPARGRVARLLGDGDAAVDALDEEAPDRRGEPHPAEVAGGVVRRHDRAGGDREAGDADRRRHRLVQVEHVEALALERRA